ncbi:MAG: TolC family protein [Verrucomicrobiae bacterium]|nr:TolC family protein [Verrucomicrobiae bacterium]
MLALLGLLVGLLQAGVAPVEPLQAVGPCPLHLEHVLASVTNQYPPLLGALIERDIAAGRLKSASGPFDFNAFAKLFGTPIGYYETGTGDVGFEQFTGIWGSTIFGGYRYTWGDRLPDYYYTRTEGAGEMRLGLEVPLLRDGSIDRRRAAVLKARLDQKLADPLIARQQLDFVRAGSVAYFNWVANGQRYLIASNLLSVARARAFALTNQFDAGLIPRIVLTDNERLIVARELTLLQSRRRFEAAALTLSLFYRDPNDSPIVAPLDCLPPGFPEMPELSATQVGPAVAAAFQVRPELRRFQLNREKLEVDRRLARNQLQPNLNAGVSVIQNFGEELYKDLSVPQLRAGLEFRVPLQRSEARGRIVEVDGLLEQLSNEERFARDRIQTEIQDAFSAYLAAHDQTRQTRLNVDLAQELLAAEEDRFRLGATDLLALQLREQAAMDARNLDVDASAEVFRALADYRAATAQDLTAP